MLDCQTGNMLIVEDDTALRERLARAMERRGFTVKAVSGVSEAMQTVAAEAPDYAIIDLRLLDGSGLDVVNELERKSPDARAIVLTGYGDIPTAVSAARLGAVDYIAKPATADEIVDALTSPRLEQPPAPEKPIPPNQARMEHIEQVFNDANRNVSHAARLLSMHRRSLQRLLRKHEITSDSTPQD